MPEKYLFIDFDNTLSDQFKLNLQMAREIGALLAPKFGGDAEHWAKHVTDMMELLEEDYRAHFVGRPLAGYCAWLEARHARSVEILFGSLGLPIPSHARELAVETQFNALTSCDAAFPGASEALLALFEKDVRVQMASANDSEFLLAALMGAGIESFTESKFGPDLVDCAKEGPEFYERIFAESGVQAAETLVIDDQPEALHWAMQVGAKVIQARLSPERHYETVSGVAAVLTDLHDLPHLVEQILAANERE